MFYLCIYLFIFKIDSMNTERRKERKTEDKQDEIGEKSALLVLANKLENPNVEYGGYHTYYSALIMFGSVNVYSFKYAMRCHHAYLERKS